MDHERVKHDESFPLFL